MTMCIDSDQLVGCGSYFGEIIGSREARMIVTWKAIS